MLSSILKFTLIASCMMLLGMVYAEILSKYKPAPDGHVCPYTVWIGTAAFAIGHGVHDVEDKGDAIKFYTCPAGTEMLVYKDKIYQITRKPMK